MPHFHSERQDGGRATGERTAQKERRGKKDNSGNREEEERIRGEGCKKDRREVKGEIKNMRK